MLLFLFDGLLLFRFAERQFCALLFQLPPRFTRFSPDCATTPKVHYPIPYTSCETFVSQIVLPQVEDDLATPKIAAVADLRIACHAACRRDAATAAWLAHARLRRRLAD